MKIRPMSWLTLCGALFLTVIRTGHAEPGDITRAPSVEKRAAPLITGVAYHVDSEGGNDDADGRSEKSAWKTLARVNRAALSPGDAVLLRCGSMWREQLTLSSGGLPGRPITYGAYGEGDRPVVNGSDLIESWAPLGENIWTATVNLPPEVVYFRGERGMRRPSIAEVNAENRWCWISNALYVYSVEPPSGVEIPGRSYCIMSGWKHDVNWIVLRDLECRQPDRYGIFNNYGGDDWLIENVVVHHIGGVEYDRAGIMVQGNRTIVRNSTVYQSAANGIDVYSNSSGNLCSGAVVEQNILYDCVHSHIDIQGAVDAVVRRNTITMREISTQSMGIFCGDTGDNVITLHPEISSNLVYNLTGNGIQLDGNTRDADVFQNTISTCSVYSFYVNNGSNPAALRNNIVYAMGPGRIFRLVNAEGKAITHNCLFLSGKPWAQDTIVNVAVNANGDSCDSRFNFRLDPEFVDIVAGDYRVGITSPCIGSGYDLGTEATDHDGFPRGAPPDVGAFENTLIRPLHKPRIVTGSLPNAASEEQYASTLQVVDADPGDNFVFSILQGPGWLEIDSSGIITGIPSKSDIGSEFPVVIRVVDSHGLSDSFSTIITVFRRNRPPSFTTHELPRAVAGKAYNARVQASDPDTGDSMRFRKRIGPAWMSVDGEGALTGSPGLNDGGRDTPVSLIVEDAGGLSDTLSVALRVLAPPRVQLLSPKGGETWDTGTVQVLRWKTTSVDSIRIELSMDSGKNWRSLADHVAASDSSLTWTVPDSVSNHCLVRITALEYPELTDWSDAPFSISPPRQTDFFIDSDLVNPGYQGVDRVIGLREENLAGFALYAQDWKEGKAAVIRMEWDSARAKFYSPGSGPHITGERLEVNGRTITPDPEWNILGDQTLYTINGITPGGVTVTLTRPAKTPAPLEEGLIFLALFKILPPFGTANNFDVRVSVDFVDNNGGEFALGMRWFTVIAMLQPPTDIWVTPIVNSPGRHRVTWKQSPSEKEGAVKCYRIFRSRSPEFNQPALRSQFTSLDALFAWEMFHTVLLDSVSAGVTEYNDPVPTNGGPYYCWIQTAGNGAESDPAISDIVVAVEEPPTGPVLGNARPNPFNPRVSIEFVLPEDGPVSLVVCNALGMKVAVLAEGRWKAGRYSVAWDAGDRPSGVYFYTLRAGAFRETKKMLLIR